MSEGGNSGLLNPPASRQTGIINKGLYPEVQQASKREKTSKTLETSAYTETPEPMKTSETKCEPTLKPMPFMLFREPETMSANLVRPALDSHWLVVAGQAWGMQHQPLSGLQVHLWGELDGFTINKHRLSGSAPAFGEAGFEFALKNLVVDSEGSLFIQLLDAFGSPLSHPVTVQTYADPEQNLIMINFKQVQ